MSTTDERDDGSVETARLEAAPEAGAEGDDIVVVPAGAGDPELHRRRRAAFALGGVVLAVLIVGAIALVARRSDSSNATVRTETPTTIAAQSISKTRPTATVPKKVAPVIVVTTVPHTTPAQSPPPQTAGKLGTLPPPTTPVVAPTVAVPKQYGAQMLTWTAPKTLTIVSGKTAALAVTAHNPTDGTVTLPHPLACTPHLDQSGICTEMAQLIPAGQSASAQYTIDAKGIAPGHYTLDIEGVLTVAVTVS